jgi:hypothetical protein
MSDAYETAARAEVAAWRAKVLRPPGRFDRASRDVQDRIIKVIPEKVHAAVTGAMEHMTKAILFGSEFANPEPLVGVNLEARERRVRATIDAYRKGAAVEGGVAGAGGFILAAADFPVLLGIKIKLLFDIAALYGHATQHLGERRFILSVFQLAFSSARHRPEALQAVEDLAKVDLTDPKAMEGFDWRRFQQEYRDYIDIAKLAQMIPVIGAPVGLVVNWRLVDQLGVTAINAYRLREGL